MRRVELVMRRRALWAFIIADPVSIMLSRKAPREKTEGGGLVRGKPELLPAQTGRIVHNTRRYFDYLVNSEAGDIPDASYLLILPYYADVQVTDTFWARGEHYKITGIHPFREESTLCAIDYEGGPNREQQ